MKKKVYIISHSHWDREWYLSYEHHHMRLVQLMDDLLDLFETDPNFNSFHLDGQTIILDDYLEVRPEKKEAIQRAITSGKLKIGPFYILQDDFLISSESNVRNMLVGMEACEKWGSHVSLGYFPDTFGNMGQTPQLMALANLDTAAFGRGVKPIGFDNEVLVDDNYASQYSEMQWIGPDDTKILGLLFANWYSNGNEIPTEAEAAKAFWDQKLPEVEAYASTPHLLMMNGVDHQPVQKDVTEAIELANSLYKDYEFIHSNFDDYIAVIKEDLPESIGEVKGELTSQETDGWFTLANTASTRVYLKQWNTKVSRQLENITEPLCSVAYELTGEYPHDQLDYAWKLLMQNHPHDSICGCSVDEVHEEMVTRFKKAYSVGTFLAQEAMNTICENINTRTFDSKGFPFMVFNTSAMPKSGTVEVEIELERITFHEQYPSEGYDTLKQTPTATYGVQNRSGEWIPAMISEPTVSFDYDLPADRFRIPYMKKTVTATIEINHLPEFSWDTFCLLERKSPVALPKQTFLKDNGKILENDFIKVSINKTGSLDILDKTSQVLLNNQMVFENVGDIGNEYIFKQPSKDSAILSTDFPFSVSIIEDTPIRSIVQLTHHLMIPKSAEESLSEEQKKVVDFRYRTSQRSEQLVPFDIVTELTMESNTQQLQFKTTVNNTATDHRLRVLFNTGIVSDQHEADSIYETVTRDNQVASYWENPTNPQHQHAFVNIHNENRGVTVSNYGLNEYEIVGETIAITLLRCVGELGDWGYFPTPEAQCLGEHSFVFGLEMHGLPETRFKTYKRAHAVQVPLLTQQVSHQEETILPMYQFLSCPNPKVDITALKHSKKQQKIITRGYNLSNEKTSTMIQYNNQTADYVLNLLEEEMSLDSKQLAAHQIITLSFK